MTFLQAVRCELHYICWYGVKFKWYTHHVLWDLLIVDDICIPFEAPGFMDFKAFACKSKKRLVNNK